MTDCKIIYGLIDQTISEDSKSYVFSSKTVFSKGNDLFISSSKNKLSYLEQNYFSLDGTFIFPDSETPLVYDVGWESQNLSDSSGNLTEYVEFDFTDLHDSYGIIIVFPTLVKDFSIQYLNGTTAIKTIAETNNTFLTYNKVDTALQWNKVIISVTKIYNPNQRARISAVTFGISFDFDADKIISIDASKAVSIKNDNTDSSECDVSFYNIGLFDIKTIKDLPVGLQSGMRMTVYFNDTLFNDYIVDTTEVEDEGKIINLTCYDRLYYLNETEFDIGKTYPSGRSLYDWAEEVASDAGIEINVDSSLQSITSKGYIGAVSHREALRLIAEAANATIKIDSGQMSIVPFATSTGSNLTEDDIVEETLQIANEDKILGVKVKQYAFTQTTDTIGLSESQDLLLTGEEQTITAEYSTYPAIATAVTSSSNITIISSKLGSEKAVITYQGTIGETGWITIVGKTYNVATANIEKGYIDSHAKEIDNTLITDATLANSVATFQMAHSSSNYNYSMETQVNLNFSLLDTFTALTYSLVTSSITISLAEDTDSMILGGEDYGE